MMEPATIGILAIVGVIVIIAYCLIIWYRVVDKSEAHVVVCPTKTMVCSGNPDYARNGGNAWYFHIPDWLPFFGRTVRIMDINIKELMIPQDTIEKGQARYSVTSSTKYRVKDVDVASETTKSDEELKQQLADVIKAGVRKVTVDFDLIEARANMEAVEKEVRTVAEPRFAQWGLELNNFQLVDFNDTRESMIVSNISLRREVEIEAETRERNAEKKKQARMKEAEADEKAQEREIARDKVVGERKQNKIQAIAEQEKLAREKEFEVTRVDKVRAQEIEKQRAIVQGEQEKRVAEIKAEQEKQVALIDGDKLKEYELRVKTKKQYEGEGDRIRLEEQAKGEAAPIREKGTAEAEVIFKKLDGEAKGKDELQKALNQFGDKAIQALVAEKVVEAQRIVGVEGAKALMQADLRVFAGSDGGGFDVGKMLESIGVASDNLRGSLLTRVMQPYGIGKVFGNDVSPAEVQEKLKEQNEGGKK